MPWLAWIVIFLFMLHATLGTCHHIQHLLVEMGLKNYPPLSRLASKLDSPDLHLPSSQDYGLEPPCLAAPIY
jgi:hypothetical protein